MREALSPINERGESMTTRKAIEKKKFSENPYVRFGVGVTAKGKIGSFIVPLVVLILAVGTMLPPTVRAEAKSVSLSCSGYTGTSTLTDFQALVKLSDGAYGFHYADCVSSDGSDIWFTDSDGNLIPHEVDTWNASGNSFVWVKIPSVKPVAEGASEITMHWGETRTAEQTCMASDTWNGFVGVWHMGMASGAENEPDVTGNGFDAVPSVVYGNGNVSHMVADPDGVVGGSRVNQVSTADNNANGLKVPDYSSAITDFARFSIGGWFRATGTVGYYSRLIAQRHYAGPRNNDVAGWEVEFGPNTATTLNTVRGMSSQRLPPVEVPDIVNNWDYIYVTYNGSIATLYVNGVAATSGSIAACTFSDYGFMIGALGGYGIGWYGRYDEVRMYNGVHTADRVKADFDTMSNPDSFLICVQDPSVIVMATWNGGANDGSVDNTANWTCLNGFGDVVENALPTSDSKVIIEGTSVNLQLPVDKTLESQSITVRDCILGADCDWRGLPPNTSLQGTVDLAGHNLHLKKLVVGVGTVTSTVSATDESASELHVDVDQGETWLNYQLVLSGAVKLVKEGEGTFGACKTDQSYGGGTEVKAGTLKIGVNGNAHPLGAYNTRVLINTNAVMDVSGTGNYNNHEFVLNGGTLCNTGADVGSGYGQFKTIRLSADSYFNARRNWGYVGNGYAATELDLAGNMLDVTIASSHFFYLINTAVSAGRIRFHGEGSLQTGDSGAEGSKGENNASHTDFIVECPLTLYAPLTVHDYHANYEGTSNTGTAVLKVCGTFKPSAHNCYYGATITDGATIDLSARTSPLDVVSSFTSGDNTLKFADGATVTIKIGKRQPSAKVPLISWTNETKPVNIGNITFIMSDIPGNWYVVKKEDGLYIDSGGIIFVR